MTDHSTTTAGPGPSGGGLFDHCAGRESEIHKAFYACACLCHPAQGGRAEDMEALCAQAREALARAGAAWPSRWEPPLGSGARFPNLFDVFCTATGSHNPFAENNGGGGAAEGEFGSCLDVYAGPPGFRYGSAAYAPVKPAFGDVQLVFSAASASVLLT